MPKSFHGAEVSGRVLNNRSIAFDAFELNRIGCGCGDGCSVRAGGFAQASRTASSPCAPVAIRNEATTRIPTVSVTTTMTTGAFILARLRGGPPRCVQESTLRRYRHRHAGLDRKHREGDDQAQRQRGDRERGRDGVGQSGRVCRRWTACEACWAGRPGHGPIPHCASESPANTARCRRARRQHCGDTTLNMAKSRRKPPLCPPFPVFRPRRRPRRPAASPW